MDDDIFGDGGISDDEGNPINLDLIPKPGLCLLCKLNDVEDDEENILCNLTRFDQRNDDKFNCGAFESK